MIKTKKIYFKIAIALFILFIIKGSAFINKSYAYITDDRITNEQARNYLTVRSIYIEMLDPNNSNKTIRGASGILSKGANSGMNVQLGYYNPTIPSDLIIRKGEQIKFRMHIRWEGNVHNGPYNDDGKDNKHTKFGVSEDGTIKEKEKNKEYIRDSGSNKFKFKWTYWGVDSTSDNNSSIIEFVITPMQSGELVVNIGAFAEKGGGGKEQTIYFILKLKGIRKTKYEEDEEYVEKMMEESYLHPEWAFSDNIEEVTFFAGSDFLHNNGLQVNESWDSQKTQEVLASIKSYNWDQTNRPATYKKVFEDIIPTLERFYTLQVEAEAKGRKPTPEELEDFSIKTKPLLERVRYTTFDDSVGRPTDLPFYDVLTDVDDYKPIDTPSTGVLEGKMSVVLTIITNMAMILSILMLAIIGVKYMLSSVEGKAEYKRDMVPYLIGACLVFGICTIIKILEAMGRSINNI